MCREMKFTATVRATAVTRITTNICYTFYWELITKQTLEHYLIKYHGWMDGWMDRWMERGIEGQRERGKKEEQESPGESDITLLTFSQGREWRLRGLSISLRTQLSHS
jgi:hypothetical protein